MKKAPDSYKVVGYIIQNTKGKFLTKRYFWYERYFWHEQNSPEEAWVHPENTIGLIRNMSESWKIKPTQKILAHYSADSGVIILGKPEPF
ncbi:MAG: hypothetical protein Q7R89_00410 [bacterium]|nr:hypothetical protein [bacterium]